MACVNSTPTKLTIWCFKIIANIKFLFLLFHQHFDLVVNIFLLLFLHFTANIHLLSLSLLPLFSLLPQNFLPIQNLRDLNFTLTYANLRLETLVPLPIPVVFIVRVIRKRRGLIVIDLVVMLVDVIQILQSGKDRHLILVHPPVHLEAVLPVEALVADIADVDPVALALLRVVQQVLLAVETSVAYRAGERFLFEVDR